MTIRTVVRRGKRRLVIDIAYRSSDGTWERYRKDAEVQTLAAARAEERRRLGALAASGSPTGAAPVAVPIVEVMPVKSMPKVTATFEEAAKIFLELYATSRLKPSTRRGYTIVLKSLLIPKLGELDLLEVDATALRELDRDLVKRGLRPSSRRNIQSVLRAVRRFAIEQGLADELPALPALPKVGATVRFAMSGDEADRVLAAVEPRYRLALELARYAGLRAGEVRGLCWGDVDLAKGILIVRRARCYGVEAPPKSGHERLVPLHGKLRASLEAAGVGPAKTYVTGPERGKPWSEFALGSAFKRACVKVGITGFRFHDLRHWFVTELFRSGASAPVVQRLAGHEHLVTTQRYSHVTLEDLEAGMRGLDGNRTVTGSSGPPESGDREA